MRPNTLNAPEAIPDRGAPAAVVAVVLCVALWTWGVVASTSYRGVPIPEIALRALLGAAGGALFGRLIVRGTRALAGRLARSAKVSGPDLWDPWLDEPGPAPGAIEPRRAPVRPRGVSIDGDALPIEDELGPLLEAGTHGAICLTGPSGSGKTTALKHLAALFPRSSTVAFLDRPSPQAVADELGRRIVVYTAEAPLAVKHLQSVSLAPWGNDELIEYLLAVHAPCCASVMGRLKNSTAERELTGGSPMLWRLILDRMAADEWIASPRQALRIEVGMRMADPVTRRQVGTDCVVALTGDEQEAAAVEKGLWSGCPDETTARLLQNRSIRLLLAAETMAASLEQGHALAFLERWLPSDLIREAAHCLAARPAALERLRSILESSERGWHASAASLLHASKGGWRPSGGFVPKLSTARLRGASWEGLDLSGAEMVGVDLSRADLRDATLNFASLQIACLAGADLRGASLLETEALRADLRGADLRSVRARGVDLRLAILEGAVLEEAGLLGAKFRDSNLAGARLTGAVLKYADLRGAKIEGADFRGADLGRAKLDGLALSGARFQGASFSRAMLSGCDLERMQLTDATFQGADLHDALLTGSSLPRADFRGACLRGAGLAEIDWEGAQLAGADLRGASFHLGSSRNGLVFSPLACEGSRTGFYTDEYNEQDFKNPEEIRKANLCGCDLRGARLLDVDFYLVDLRGARYDAVQADHFRRCGAILESPG